MSYLSPQIPALSLADVASAPSLHATQITARDGEVLDCRPLKPDDAPALAAFLTGLSEETRRRSTFDGYDLAEAEALCGAIAMYDKLRLVVVGATGDIVGLNELSFGIPQEDSVRYAGYGVELDEHNDCRFGPTLADAYQHRGIGGRAFVHVQSLVQRFGRSRIILWGGVLADNAEAIRFYDKLGFATVGSFTRDGQKNYDMVLDLRALE